MIGKSYSKNYLKIYLWQGISLILNFASLFVVIPMISTDKTTYGIYTVCMSLSIFLSYADLGFLGAGQKFAAEYFARGNYAYERKIIGFTGFVLLIFLLILSTFFLFLSYMPHIVISKISESEGVTASGLLFILAIFTPVTLLQRLVQTIFMIRMEDYVFQRINIIGNILKILSVFYFFGGEKYNIVGYFLFFQIVNLFTSIINLSIAKSRYKYDMYDLIKNIKCDKTIFKEMKPLAFSMLFAIASWVLYYELDTVVIGNVLGADSVAVYGVGFSFLTFIRNLLGIMFSPFSTRFNHFQGMRDENGLKLLIKKIVVLYAPFVTIPLVALCFMATPFVLSWVGQEYLDAIPIVQLLVLCNIFAFISYPVGMLLVAKQRLKEMYLVNVLTPIVFWSGILLTESAFGVYSFAIFKLVTFTFVAGFYYKILAEYLAIDFFYFFKKCISISVFPFLFLALYSSLIDRFFLFKKGWECFLLCATLVVIGIVISFFIQFLVSPHMRKAFYSLQKNI